MGRYPHNVGYVSNGALDSIAAFAKVANNTVGSWLRQAGYHTAFLGKYVNAMECDVPSGWSYWGSLTCTNIPDFGPAGGTYNYYNSSQWAGHDLNGELIDKTKPKQIIHTGDHQTDFLSRQAIEQVQLAKSRKEPFFLHLTPLTVHAGTCYGPQPLEGYADEDPFRESLFKRDPDTGFPVRLAISPCPTVKNAHNPEIMKLQNPHVPSYDKFANVPAGSAVPTWVKNGGNWGPCCSPWQSDRQDIGFRVK